jgi:uncharacterized membrane protein
LINKLDEVGNLLPARAALSCRQQERNYKFVHLKSLISWCTCKYFAALRIVGHLCNLDEAKDFVCLLHKATIKYILRQPETVVFLLNLLVNIRLDLNGH